jgi:hypothetical protein
MTNITNILFYPFLILFYVIYPKPELPAEAQDRGLNAEEKKMLDDYSKKRQMFTIGVGLITYYLIYRMLRKK